MKKQDKRILGRRLATEMSREELDKIAGATELERSSEIAAVSTWTLTYPADGPYKDNGGGGGIA
jgi:hypothetical protein